MSTPTQSLLWKQWHEDKRPLAAFTGCMVLAAVYVIVYERIHPFRAPVGSFSHTAHFYTMISAVILAMRAARGEHTEGVHGFSASLPVSMRRMAILRILGAALAMTLPIVVATLLLSLALSGGLVEQAMPRAIEAYVRMDQRATAPLTVALGQLWSTASISICSGMELLLVLSIAGCWLRNPSQVALLGAVGAIGMEALSGLLWFQSPSPSTQLIYGSLLPNSLVVHWGYGSRQGDYIDHQIVPNHWISIGFSVLMLVILGRVFAHRYGAFTRNATLLGNVIERTVTPPASRRIPPQHATPIRALLWAEGRQSLPLAAAGLLVALTLAVCDLLMEHRLQGHSFGSGLLMVLPHYTGMSGILWASVVGSSLYSAELGNGLGAFWRSTPIRPSLWFWSKFVVGLLAMLLVLDGIPVAVSWASPRESLITGMSWTYIACMPLLHVFLYSVAVLGTCWSRKPVFGGFVAIFGYMLITIVTGLFPATQPFDPIKVHNRLLYAERAGNPAFLQHGYPMTYGALAVMSVVVASIAHRQAKPWSRIP